MFPTTTNDALSARSGDITDDGERVVISASYPALVRQKVKPFRQYLTDDGEASGSNSFAVNGAVTNAEFYIAAHEEDDRYITSLNFIVGYASTGKPYQFGKSPALTNGVRLHYTTKGGQYDIHDGIKSNQDMFRLSFSQIPTAWEVRHVNANNDYGYFISMDLTRMGLPFGIKLDAGSTQKLIITIRDDVTVVDSFDCIAYGFNRFK